MRYDWLLLCLLAPEMALMGPWLRPFGDGASERRRTLPTRPATRPFTSRIR